MDKSGRDSSEGMLLTVKQAIERHSPTDGTGVGVFVVGCSGGPDSMVLLDILVRLGYGIFVVHVEHGIRGDASLKDAEFVADWCQKRGIAHEVVRFDVPAIAAERKKGLEETARALRMEAFAAAAERIEARYILTAHHGDDRNETVLHHFLRGSGVHGLSGIRTCEWTYLRPLLSLSKAEILDYAESEGIPYRMDETNTDTRYTRNAIRHDIFGMIEPHFPEYRKTLGAAADYFGELGDFLTAYANEWIQTQSAKHLHGEQDEMVGKNEIECLMCHWRFSVQDFLLLHAFAQKEVLYALYVLTNGNGIGLSKANIEELLRYVRTAQGGTGKTLGKLLLKKRNGEIRWESSMNER